MNEESTDNTDNNTDENINLNINKILKAFKKETIPSFQKDLEFFIENWSSSFQLEKVIEINKKMTYVSDRKKEIFWNKVNDLADKLLSEELI